MSGQMQRPEVPTGVQGKKGFQVTTTQKKVDGKVPAGFHVGYTTEWDSVHTEVPYQTPKKP